MSKQKPARTVPRLRFAEFRDAGEWEYLHGDQLFEHVSNKNHNSDLPILAITQEQGAIPRELIDYHVSVSGKSVKSYKVVEIGNFIISLRSFQGGIEYSNYLGLCSPAYIILRKKLDVLNDFYRYYFKSFPFIQDLNRNLEGIRDGKMISYNQFSDILIPKPKPDEQQKIAACLTSLDELISAATGRLDALKQHKQGLMQQLFPAEGETVPRLRFPEFREAGEWKVEKLGTISKIVRGGSPRPIDQYITNDENGLNWLKIGDISKDSKYIIQTKERIEKTALSKTRLMNPGNLIMSNSMSFGRPYILKIETCIHDGWIAITIDEDIDSDYLYYFILSDSSQTYFLNSAAGSGVKNLNIEIVRQLSIFFSYKKEQQKIAACLTALDDLISAQAQKIAELKTHKRGLMQQLFPAVDETH